MKAAIFGGSFDPPHVAHEQIALKSLETLDIDRLYVVPSFLNPFKKKFHFTPETRYELIQELFSEYKSIEVSDYELKQQKPTASIDTVEYFLREYNIEKLYLIIGSDNLSTLHLWQSFDRLKGLVEFVVFTRCGFEETNVTIPYKKIQLSNQVSSTMLRDTLDLQKIPKKFKKR